MESDIRNRIIGNKQADEHTNSSPEIPTPPPKKSGFKHWLSEKITTKEFRIGAIVFILLLGGGIAFGLTHSANAPTARPPKKPQPIAVKPVVYYSPLSGLPVTQAQTKLPVTAVMIENSDGARPQSGLSQASVVFEALAEGGITRFMALFQDNQPDSVGPIRSARPYFLDWLVPFNASYAHVGGSPDALAAVQSLHIRDMNEFYYGNYYHRISSRDAPHNVYTSISQLISLEQSKSWGSSTFTPFTRKSDSPSKAPTVTSVDFNPSYADMEVHYDYDPALNSYKRSEAAAPMTDAATNKQLEPKVVIGMVVPWTYGALDASGARYIDYSDVGSGTAYIFQDGTMTQGVWQKASQTSQIQFKTASGTIIPLNAGQTWITAIGTTAGVSYK